MNTLILAVMVGLALALLVYAASNLVRELGGAETEYRDRPPLGFRWLWPLVNIFANTFGFLLTKERLEAVWVRLRKAGQEYSLTPHQFMGGKVVGLLLGAGAGTFLGGTSYFWTALLIGGGFGFMYPDMWLRDRTKARNLAILKALPFFLDIVTLSIESGLNLTSGLKMAVDKCRPGPLMVEINRVLRDVRAGKPRVEALRDLSERLDYAPISSLVSALVQGELMGSSLSPILRAQSDQRRTERFQRAEKLAMEAPVKMLGPLVLFIFPCTFVVIGFPNRDEVHGVGHVNTRSAPRVLLHNHARLPDWRIRVAQGWWRRAVGLLATAQLDDPRGLWISPCNSVHTIGMRYAIDIVFLDDAGRVTKLVRRLKPFRAAACRGARSTLELRAGAIDELSFKAGDVVALQG